MRVVTKDGRVVPWEEEFPWEDLPTTEDSERASRARVYRDSASFIRAGWDVLRPQGCWTRPVQQDDTDPSRRRAA
jgi:hypothetical protein